MIYFGEGSLGLANVNISIGNDKYLDYILSNSLSEGIFANLRPNLIVKPITIVKPREPLDNEIKKELFYGVIQYAVAKAVADLDLNENLKIIVSVNIPDVPLSKLHKRKVFQSFYSSTKLAIKRALNNYPSIEKIKKEKFRALHPLVGFRDCKLENTPYLQIALDVPTMEDLEFILNSLPNSDHLILEAGTPLIKRFGLEVIEEIRNYFDGFIVADLKTLDTGRVEVRLAFEHTANAVVISGLAPKETILKAIDECEKCGLISYLDMLNVDNPKKLYNSLEKKPDVVVLHRGIDEEKNKKIDNIKFDCLTAIAGGVRLEDIDKLIEIYDIVVVGRAITKSKDPGRVVRYILNKMGYDIDTYRLYFDEDEM
ncbi:bifunctional 5,6,7,8-tetrahydromethanopterin hydro-lyase/3-hexulose-6-phosphate synthase [Methanocaldococcus indicus]|uniref:bifunctional 5,6,7,8-tetrahydromethanopterin hydro-lyase/3-hexulose-6-phosphate synthase n=1 Tax=Methanocaldococcus indicus TaxID=213231 RepID=UPI003C6CFC63